MGLLNWLFESNVESSELVDVVPSVNFDGTPMLLGSTIDIESKVYGQCRIDPMSSSYLDSSMDTLASTMDSYFDDSFSSMNDDW